jgi:glycosyltransferase involved in cell wall biosynthesis
MTDVRPRRIALPLESDGPGGAEMMLIQFAEELRRRGHHVIPVGPAAGCGWLGGEFRKRGFAPQVFELHRALDPGTVRGLVRLFREQRVDLVHSHEFTMAVYGAVAAKWVGIPHVITLHGGQSVLKAARRRVALKAAFRLSRAVVACSGATREQFTQELSLASERILTIPNGIAFRAGDRSKVRRALGIGDDELLVLAVGRLVELKGHMVLLRALAQLRRAGLPDTWQVAIAGQGELEGVLRAFISEAGLVGRAHILGHRDDVPDLLAGADIFTMPSLWEGLPVALLEAMFACKPVIASACSGIPEAIESGTHGLLVPPGDQDALAEVLRRVLSDPDLRGRLGEAARDRASERYSVAAMVDAYEVVYGLRTAPA